MYTLLSIDRVLYTEVTIKTPKHCSGKWLDNELALGVF